MFGFLKDKLKEWVGKAKEKIAGAEEEEEEIKEEEIKKPAKTKKEKQEKKAKEKQKKEVKKQKQEEQIIEEFPKPKPEELGTSIEIEQEVEEGVSEEDKEDIKEIEIEIEEKEEAKEETEQPKEEKKGFFAKLKERFSYKITEEEFDSIFEDLEMSLLENNVALEAVESIRDKLKQKLLGREIKKQELEEEIKNELKNSLNEIIIEPDDPIIAVKAKKQQNEPFVILFFGINGTGKTTTIAKLANLFQKNKFSVVLAAADTFRAASIEQIAIHADKLKVPLIKHDYGSDPSAVGFDAIKYAKTHKIDVVLIDTAGRMHTKENLLSEMEKICRVTKPDLKIFVAESIAGNDATEQAKAFNEMIGIDGAILTKADVDEKGGTIISVSNITHKPVFYLGTGQEYKDIELFNKENFIKSLGL